MNQSSIETHVASAVALVGSGLAAVHPGFTLPSNTAAILSTLLALGAVGLQWLHKIQQAPKGQKLKVVESAASTVEKAVADGQATATISTVKTTVGEVQTDAKEVNAELDSKPVSANETVAPPPPA